MEGKNIMTNSVDLLLSLLVVAILCIVTHFLNKFKKWLYKNYIYRKGDTSNSDV